MRCHEKYNALGRTIKKKKFVIIDDEKNIHATLLNQLDDYQIYFTGKIFESLKENIKNQKHIFFKGKQDFPVDYLAKQLKVGKKIYFKGSRSSKMEIYLNMLLND